MKTGNKKRALHPKAVMEPGGRVDSVKSLRQWINAGAHDAPGVLRRFRLDLNYVEFAALLDGRRLQVVNSRSGPYSIVSAEGDRYNAHPINGCSEFHTDGLYCDKIPDLVFLYCHHPGAHRTPTVLSDVQPVIDNLRKYGVFDLLRTLEIAYTFGQGRIISIPIIGQHSVLRRASNSYGPLWHRAMSSRRLEK